MTHRWIALMLGFAMVIFTPCNDDALKPPPDPPPHVQQDTTSHDVEWTVYTWGDPNKGTSVFYDVFALNDTCVCAVGEVLMTDTYSKDSTGKRIDPLNVARWNGKEWKLSTVQSRSWAGGMDYGRLQSIWAFSPEDIWIATYYGSYIHITGNKIASEKLDGFHGSPARIWGRSPDEFYICGTNGSLTRYHKGFFYLIETGTDVYLSDVYGAANGDVWTGGYQYWDTRSAFLKITGSYVQSINKYPLKGGKAIWVSKDSMYADVGSGFLVQSLKDSAKNRFQQWKDIVYPLGYIHSLRGTANNNIFAVGDYGTIMHFNGKSWNMYPVFNLAIPKRFYGVAIAGQNIFVVGKDEFDRAIIYHGYQQRR